MKPRESTAAAQAAAARHELDRRKVEAIATRRVLIATTKARRLITAAAEMGVPIRQASRTALSELAGEIQRASLLGFLEGLRRSRLTVKRYVDQRGIALSTAFDGAIEFLNKRLLLTDAELAQIQSLFGTEALKATNGLTTMIETSVQEALRDNTLAGGSVRDGIRAVNRALDSAGVTPLQPHRVESIVRTQTQIAYSAGRVNALRDPVLQDILWGFEYVAIQDDRTRPTHAAMDGVRAPKDDPLWKRWTPPCGYNCRCSTLEIFEEERYAEPTAQPDVEPDDGFGFNPGDVFRSVQSIAA